MKYHILHVFEPSSRDNFSQVIDVICMANAASLSFHENIKFASGERKYFKLFHQFFLLSTHDFASYPV